LNWFKKIASDNYFYVINCVNSTAEDIDYMIDHASQITFEEFITQVNNEEFREMEREMGYPANDYLKEMKDDYAVSFWHSIFRGIDAYYFEHSRIEYVFTLNGQMGEDQDYDELV
jgi:hypothetical protein